MKRCDGEDVRVTITDHDDFSIDNGYLTMIQTVTQTIVIQTPTVTRTQTAILTQTVTQIQIVILTQTATRILIVIGFRFRQ